MGTHGTTPPPRNLSVVVQYQLDLTGSLLSLPAGAAAPVRILLVSGSTRAMSTNSAFVRTAAKCAPPGVTTVRYGLTALPHFNPDDDRDPLPPAVAALRAGIDSSQALLFCTPEYAGTLPGSMKNLLDWTVGGPEMAGKPAAWVNVAADERRGHGATTTLETVLGYVRARTVVEACRHFPITREAVGTDGLIDDPRVRAVITDILATLAAAVTGTRAGGAG